MFLKALLLLLIPLFPSIGGFPAWVIIGNNDVGGGGKKCPLPSPNDAPFVGFLDNNSVAGNQCGRRIYSKKKFANCSMSIREMTDLG